MISVVYPPFISFDTMVQRPQQLLKHLARLGVQAIYHDVGMWGRKPPFREVEPNLYVLSQDAPLHTIPHHPTVLWISYPPHWNLINRYYDERWVVFDICDAAAEEFADWGTGTDNMLERADLVVCSSWPLYRQYQGKHPSVYLCPNGVDYDHFASGSAPPADLTALRGPRIGYHGAVASWLDWDLIEELAHMRPDWNFIFVGPPYNLQARELPQAPNLIYCGEVAYKNLASYVQAFDAGIVPFRVSEMTCASDPIKVYEYLAAGKGVVSSRLPQAEMNPLVTIADHAAGFAQALETILGESPCQRQERQHWAKNNSWKRRAQVIVAALQAWVPQDGFEPSPPPSPMQRDLAAFLLREVPATSYLEVGAGTGLTSHCLVAPGRRIAAVDQQPESLVRCRRHSGVEAYRADMFALPFADAEFDVVWNAGVLEHYPPHRQVEALREMKRVASKAVVAAVPYRHCQPYRLGRHTGEKTQQWPYGDEETYETLAPLFAEAGLVLEKETDLCPEAGYWFMDQYVSGWREFLSPACLGRTGYLLAGIGRPPC